MDKVSSTQAAAKNAGEGTPLMKPVADGSTLHRSCCCNLTCVKGGGLVVAGIISIVMASLGTFAYWSVQGNSIPSHQDQAWQKGVLTTVTGLMVISGVIITAVGVYIIATGKDVGCTGASSGSSMPSGLMMTVPTMM